MRLRWPLIEARAEVADVENIEHRLTGPSSRIAVSLLASQREAMGVEETGRHETIRGRQIVDERIVSVLAAGSEAPSATRPTAPLSSGRTLRKRTARECGRRGFNFVDQRKKLPDPTRRQISPSPPSSMPAARASLMLIARTPPLARNNRPRTDNGDDAFGGGHIAVPHEHGGGLPSEPRACV